MAPTWTFASNGEGEEHGFNNAAVETFKGKLDHSLAREAIQNSLDARASERKPVLVTFEVVELPRDDVPGLDDLVATFQACAKYLEKNKKAKAFFDRAQSLASAKTIRSLRIADENTTGVGGADTDRDGGWYNLVRCVGSSAKGGGEGGSFGLGKHAPFAVSQFRTVFYSTRTEGDEVAFLGVARLVTHDHAKQRRQPTGYLGGANGKSVRSKKDVPKAFRRETPGTDVYALAYPGGPDWQAGVVASVLEYFWPAVYRKDLKVAVGDVTIDAASLPALLEAHQNRHRDFHAFRYFKAYTEGAAKLFGDTLPILKDVTVKLLPGDPEAPKHVAMIRRTGMVIFHKRFMSPVPFCGVFECRNKDGNEKLREMEPPRHDAWDKDLPEKGDNTKTEREFVEYIRDCIKQLAPPNAEKSIAPPDLSRYLPDDGSTPEDVFDGPPADGTGTHEGFDRTPVPTKPLPGRPIGRKPPTKPGGSVADGGDDPAGGADPGDEGGDANGGGGGDKGSEGGGTDDGGVTGGDTGRTPVEVRSRAFLCDPAAGLYALAVHPPHPRPAGDVYLSVGAVGDDALATAVRVAAARVAGGKSVGVGQPGRVGPVRFPKSGPLRVEVTLAEPRRLALDVSAYEVPADEAE